MAAPFIVIIPARAVLSALQECAAAGAKKRKRNKVPQQSFRSRLRRDKQMLLMMVPGVLFLLLFFYIPILGNVIAFQDYQPYLGIGDSLWVGWQNFVDLFGNRPSKPDPAFDPVFQKDQLHARHAAARPLRHRLDAVHRPARARRAAWRVA